MGEPRLLEGSSSRVPAASVKVMHFASEFVSLSRLVRGGIMQSSPSSVAFAPCGWLASLPVSVPPPLVVAFDAPVPPPASSQRRGEEERRLRVRGVQRPARRGGCGTRSGRCVGSTRCRRPPASLFSTTSLFSPRRRRRPAATGGATPHSALHCIFTASSCLLKTPTDLRAIGLLVSTLRRDYTARLHAVSGGSLRPIRRRVSRPSQRVAQWCASYPHTTPRGRFFTA